jgi:hypothetical protein
LEQQKVCSQNMVQEKYGVRTTASDFGHGILQHACRSATPPKMTR